MKLTQLFESKKEAKQRNPVAQELRANPQFKSKTEIDKKKEVKKGYQKHKNKVDESTDVDTAYVKKVIAQHSDEYKKFLDTGDLMDAPSVYEKLFAYFHFETGEMPYGTAKARDGDPYVWIADKLADLGLAEQVDYKTVDRFHKKLDKLVHKTFGHSSDEKKEKDVEENWENTILNKIFRHSKISLEDNKNKLLEFTATIPEEKNVLEKYQDYVNFFC